ncbi:MAG: hypothetical protein IJK92_10375 [Bacteroidales bacterium]|nr:hypothetical protein [Bacteroidales bacterium]
MSEKKFWNKIKNNKFYLALTTIIGAILLFLLVLYLAVPSYTFSDIEPFKGDFIYNPYSEINRINYVDFRSESVENQGIDVYEFGYALTGTRYLCLGYKEKRVIDYPFFQSIHYKQFNIDKLNKKCRLVAPAHPSKGFRQGQMTRLDHYRVMEALSPNDNSLFYWDIALSNGHRVNIIATGENFTTACIGENDAESILKSLETGNSYAVSYNGNLAQVPQLVDVTVKNGNLFVTVSEIAKEMRFIGQNAEVKSVAKNVAKGFYPIQKEDTYIRAEVEFYNGNTLYLNPIVRHQYQYFFDLNKAAVMKGRTYLMWAVYILVAVFLVRMFIVKKNENPGE